LFAGLPANLPPLEGIRIHASALPVSLKRWHKSERIARNDY